MNGYSYLDIVANVIIVLSVPALAIGSIAIKRLIPYFDEKAKNLATRQDIAGITREIESVKSMHAMQLEKVRIALGSQLYIHQTRYAKEFEILSEIMPGLVALRDAAKRLRPVGDIVRADEEENDRRRRRLDRFNQAAKKFYNIYESKQPFYPEEIYTALVNLHEAAIHEVTQFSIGDAVDRNRYWKQAMKNAERISQLADCAVRSIRDRVKQWERLDFPELRSPDSK